jgi:hypothetical protein
MLVFGMRGPSASRLDLRRGVGHRFCGELMRGVISVIAQKSEWDLMSTGKCRSLLTVSSLFRECQISELCVFVECLRN